MAVTRAKAWPYAEKLLSRPSGNVNVTLRAGKGGVTILHGRNALSRCYNNPPGRLSASIVAQALGVQLPFAGHSVTTTVSTGVLWRAISISSLDPRIPEAQQLIERFLKDATDQLPVDSAIDG